jgi:hypothetical protein
VSVLVGTGRGYFCGTEGFVSRGSGGRGVEERSLKGGRPVFI